MQSQRGEKLHLPVGDPVPAWAQGAALELVGHSGDSGVDVGPGDAGRAGGLRPGGVGEQLQVSRVAVADLDDGRCRVRLPHHADLAGGLDHRIPGVVELEGERDGFEHKEPVGVGDAGLAQGLAGDR